MNQINPKQPLIFKVKGNDYPVKTPNVGQLLLIEELKSSLTNGQYGSVLSNRTVWSEYSLDNVDMFANITALCPQLIEDLKVDSWKELDPFDLEELRIDYREQFSPWFNAFTEMLRKVQTASTDEQSTKTK